MQSGATFHPGGRQDTVAVRVRAGLPDAGYTVTYRVISADSHPVSGGFVFNVGTGGGRAKSVDAALGGSSAGRISSTALAAARAVQFGAIALALGAWLFALVCWLPGLREVATARGGWLEASAGFARRTRVLLLVAAGAGAVSAVAAIVLQGAVAGGTSFWHALDASVVDDVLGTRFGRVFGVAFVAWLGLALLAAPRRAVVPALRPASLGATGVALPGGRLRAATALQALPLALLAFVPALSGHGGVEDPTWLMLPANVVHVVCISAWLGGVATMVVALRAATHELDGPDRTRLLAATVSRFSTLAGVAFALILATGIGQALIAIDAWSELTSTGYGRAVLIKLILFVVLVYFGAVNRRSTLPALRTAAADGLTPGEAGAGLLDVLRTELVIGIVVLGVTGALATYAPGRDAAAGPFSASTVLGPARAELTVDPARIGPDELHVYLFERRSGTQYDRVKEFTAAASLPSEHVADVPVHFHRAGPGHFVSMGASFPIAGDWKLRVTARVSDFDEYSKTFEVPVGG